ncbi:helix-turn-helix domain-containing protein [Umezawaea sp. NPDC059074]|uniref:helix-turn-helix domain-containing protein n=1 Tax=Umezawaea sp. NPDC059074 TaxID=3346716 RepID=UPI0036800B78
MSVTPTPRKKRLGQHLRAIRERSLKTTDAVADLLRVDLATISRYETGYLRPSWPAVLAMLQMCDGTPEDRARALELWEDAGHRAVRLTLPAGASKEFRAFLRAEAEADIMRVLSPMIVDGLLQTPAYARAIHDSAHRFRDPETKVEPYVTARLSRQKRLEGPTALQIHALLDEAVIKRAVGGPAVMAEQLRHLLDLGERQNIKIQVVPFGAGAYGNMSGGCSIIGYADQDYAPAVYVEHSAGGVWVEDGTDVQRFQSAFDDTVEAALDPKASADLIRSQLGVLKE